MAARTLPTLPNFTTGQELTSSELNQLANYQEFWANPPMFRMYQTVAQPLATGSTTPTQVAYDTVQYDTDSGRSGTTPWSYVIPFAGRWYIAGSINWPGNATGYRYTAIYQNGVGATGGKTNSAVNAAGNSTVTEASATIPCNAGDVIAIFGVQNSGSALTTIVNDMTQAGFFEGRLVSLANP